MVSEIMRAGSVSAVVRESVRQKVRLGLNCSHHDSKGKERRQYLARDKTYLFRAYYQGTIL